MIDRKRLAEIELPFRRWHESGVAAGLEQYSLSNCLRAEQCVRRTFEGLLKLPNDATEDEKLAVLKTSVLALNQLNDEVIGFVETDEREELCDLYNEIAVAAGLDPGAYGDGEGPASEWREW